MVLPFISSSPLGSENDNFQNQILDHKNVGCPINSKCTKESGIKRNKWISALKKVPISAKNQTLLNKLKNKNGIPLTMWGNSKILKNKAIISWQSDCRRHNTPNNKFLKAQIFLKSMNQLKKFKNIIPRYAYLLKNDHTIKYTIPIKEIPTHIENNKLIFLQEIDSEYYTTSISKKGTIKVVPYNKKMKKMPSPEEIKCPNLLINQFEKDYKNYDLFEKFFCERLWDSSQKKYHTLLLGWSC